MNRVSRIAERLTLVKPSSTLAITSKAKKLKAEGKDVVSFGAGEPDFDTPDFVKAAAIEALNGGFTKYTPTTGIPELKSCIAEKFARDNGLSYAANQIIVSCGAKHSIFNALMALVGAGDEVLIPSPFWVSYPEMVRLCQATPRFIETSPQNDFKLDIATLRDQVTPRTKVLVLNSPSNPVGCVYTLPELEQIAQLCVQKGIFVISDEIYEKIIYDGLRHYSIASLGKEIYDLTVTVNGLSKSHSMTGWRIGYIGAPADIAAAVSNLQDHSTSNPTSIAQKAAVAALKAGDAFTEKMCAQFRQRRDYLMKRVSSMPKLSFIRAQGAFYLFCGIGGTKLDSATFAARALEEILVAVIPGDAFGRDDYIRLSFATSLQEIEKGMDRLETWLKKL